MTTSRERVLHAIHHQPVDQIPLDCWITPETEQKLRRHFHLNHRTELLDRLQVDILYIEGPAYLGPPLKVYPDGSEDDIWGVRRKTCCTGQDDKKQSYKTVVSSPLQSAASLQDILDYPLWPHPDHFDYDIIKQQCRQAGDRAVFFMGDRLNRIAQLKPAQYLRSLEQILMDSLLNPEIFAAIITRIRTFYRQYLERILQAADGLIDVVVTGDDFGTQNGLMISRSTWCDTILPGFREFIDLGHSFGVPVMHHTCGAVAELIDDMIDAGLDVLNPLQPGAAGMEHQKLKALYGRKLCFHGGISIQTNLPFGQPQAVRAEVKTAFETLGRDSGYLACTAHNIQADAPLENVLALFDAYHQYR